MVKTEKFEISINGLFYDKKMSFVDVIILIRSVYEFAICNDIKLDKEIFLDYFSDFYKFNTLSPEQYLEEFLLKINQSDNKNLRAYLKYKAYNAGIKFDKDYRKEKVMYEISTFIFEIMNFSITKIINNLFNGKPYFEEEKIFKKKLIYERFQCSNQKEYFSILNDIFNQINFWISYEYLIPYISVYQLNDDLCVSIYIV